MDRLAELRAPEEFDIAAAPLVRRRVVDALGAGTTDIRIDLSGVTFMDSAGVGVLIGAHRRVQAVGGTLTLVRPSARIVRVLSILGLDRYLDIELDLTTAEAHRQHDWA